MKTGPSLLAPLIRSDTVGRLLAELLLHPDDEHSLAGLGRAVGAHPGVVHREVVRLIDAGLLTDRRVGQSRHVKVDLAYPVLHPLTELITATYGPVPVIREALTGVDGIDLALVYGSWAARLAGTPGPFPRDVDVLVVGTTPRSLLREISERVSGRLHLEVNITRVSQQDWSASTDQFVSTVRSRPTVALQVAQDSA